MTIVRPAEQRFWEKVDIRAWNDCWPWTAGSNDRGYGQLWLEGGMVAAHRLAYKLSYDDYNYKLDVLHTCDTPRCCNPGHLFQGTDVDNMQDAINKGRFSRHLPAWLRENISWYKGALTARATAELFGINETTVSRVWRDSD